MIMGRVDDRRAAGALGPFSELLAITETAFVDAGLNLEASMTQFQSLRSAFSALELALGPEAESTLKAMVEDVTTCSDRLRTGFDQIGTTSVHFRQVMAQVRSEVRNLNTVVQLFANIWLNTRIQGNGLMRPRPQIMSFIERLGSLSGEAGSILREVNDEMAAAMDAMTMIEAAQAALSDELSQTTYPAIESFTSVARAISDEQAGLHDASVMISDRMKTVSSDIATLITSLQIGDTLRQRLEQVHTALALASPTPAAEGLSLRLASGLGEGALASAIPPIDVAIHALDAVAKAGQDIGRTAGSSGFGMGMLHRAQVVTGSVVSFEHSIVTTRHHFAQMEAAAQKACQQIDLIRGHYPALQRIAQQLRLAGINAVIACARLGEEGRALRELAQWLRAGTDESDSTMQRLHTALDQSHASVYSISEETVAACEADLAAFLTTASQLASTIGGANDSLMRTTAQMDDAAKDVRDRLAIAGTAMQRVRAKIDSSRATPSLLLLSAAQHPDPDLTLPEVQEYLSALRRKYTMASERSLHDDLVQRLSGPSDPTSVPRSAERDTVSAAPFVATTPTGGTGAEDDLEDILF